MNKRAVPAAPETERGNNQGGEGGKARPHQHPGGHGAEGFRPASSNQPPTSGSDHAAVPDSSPPGAAPDTVKDPKIDRNI